MMNKKALQTLEYDKIIEQLAELAQTPGGQKKCRDLVPMTDQADILSAQRETSDAEMRIIGKGSLSFGGVKDVRGSLMRLQVGGSLSARELLAIGSLLDAAGRAKAY